MNRLSKCFPSILITMRSLQVRQTTYPMAVQISWNSVYFLFLWLTQPLFLSSLPLPRGTAHWCSYSSYVSAARRLGLKLGPFSRPQSPGHFFSSSLNLSSIAIDLRRKRTGPGIVGPSAARRREASRMETRVTGSGLPSDIPAWEF